MLTYKRLFFCCFKNFLIFSDILQSNYINYFTVHDVMARVRFRTCDIEVLLLIFFERKTFKIKKSEIDVLKVALNWNLRQVYFDESSLNSIQ